MEFAPRCHQLSPDIHPRISPHSETHHIANPLLPWHCSIPQLGPCSHRMRFSQYWSLYRELSRWSSPYSHRMHTLQRWSHYWEHPHLSNLCNDRKDLQEFAPRYHRLSPEDPQKISLHSKIQYHSNSNFLLPWHCNISQSILCSHRMRFSPCWPRYRGVSD